MKWHRPLLAVVTCLGIVLGLGLALTRLRESAPDDVYEFALNALENGRFDEAESAMIQLSRIREPTVLDQGVNARLAIAHGHNLKAMKFLGAIPDNHALAGWSHLRMGQLHRQASRLPKAEAEFRKALTLEPNLVSARRELLYVLGLQLRRQELCQEFEKLAVQTTVSPKDVWFWGMARDLVWWSPFEHIPLLTTAIAADPNDRYSRLALAEVERRQGHFDQAMASLEGLSIDDDDALTIRAGIALDRESVEAAESLLRQGAEIHPGLDALRGRLAISHRDPLTAVKALERANRAEPGRRQTISDLGRAWRIEGDAAKSGRFVDLATKIDQLSNLLMQVEHQIDRPNPALWTQLARACEAADRFHEARAWFQLVLAQNPTDPDVQRSLFQLDSRLRP